MTTEKNALYHARWDKFSKLLHTHQLDAWLQPTTDEFQSEYTADYAQRLYWLSRFTGSAGMGVLTAQHAHALFVDGRYTVQARQEVPDGMEVFLSSQQRISEWLKQKGAAARVGIDPWLHTLAQLEGWQKDGLQLVPMPNLVDRLWTEKPAMPAEPLTLHPVPLAGRAAAEKIAALQEWLAEKHCDALWLAASDAVMWLLNIRGADIPYNPLALCHACITRRGTITLYMAPRHHRSEIADYFAALSVECADISALWSGDRNPFEGIASCAIDTSVTPYALIRMAEAAGCALHFHPDPATHAKAIKSEAERIAMRDAHRRDGLALCKFIRWFYQQSSVDELQVIAVLEAFRREDASYRQPSFPTIAGAGPHGAIVHYRASSESNRRLQPGELLLLDSGGHYAGGTTDVTRTMVLGTPDERQRQHYTRVLKGHIALSMARFPAGITGNQLDPLARQFLWQIGADYKHGTGHGVGAYLCVHEGPQSISSRANSVALEAGMILSNEPGYYCEGQYGIRIENLIEITQAGQGVEGGVLASQPLTMAPYDLRLIDSQMLRAEEKDWLNRYHTQLRVAMAEQGADAALLTWLEEETKAI